MTFRKIYIGLGSNLGNKVLNIRTAFNRIAQLYPDLKASLLYKTKPWGYESDNDFINAAASFESDDTPELIYDQLHAIEVKMGKKTGKGVYQDRIIDIDILLIGDLIINTDKLKVPHPFLLERAFVMKPLLDVGNPFHPIEKKEVRTLYDQFTEKEEMIRIDESG